MSINYCVTVSAPGYPAYCYGGYLSPVTSASINGFVEGIIGYYRSVLAIPSNVYIGASIPTPYPPRGM
jgi:hypothetical protein